MSLNKTTVGFLGGGAMAESMFRGLVESGAIAPASICVYDIFPARREAIASMNLGIKIVESTHDLVAFASIVLLATKPDAVGVALASIRDGWTQDKLLMSICAGVTLTTLDGALAVPSPRVVRVMPNMPCAVRAASSAISCNPECDDEDRAHALAIMSEVGTCDEVAEKLMDAVTGLAGSGPGYTFMFIEALADAAVKQGLPRAVAKKMAAQVVYGTAKVSLNEPSVHPAELRNRVESPGGTTVAGTAAMEAAGFRAAVAAGVEASTVRSSELGKK